MSSLHEAIAAGDLARVNTLIRNKTDLNERDAERRTPLHHAIELERDDIALALLGNGADATLRVFSTTSPRDDDVGMNALHWAAARGRTAILRAILDRNVVDINSLGSYHKPASGVYPITALLFALGGDDYASPSDDFFSADCAFALLDAGADPNMHVSMWSTALHLCALRCEGVSTDAERLAVIRALLAKGAVTDTWREFNMIADMQPLQAAVSSGFYEAAELLIAAGAPVDLLNFSFVRPPPLFFAPYGGRFDVFQLLLDNGADILAVDDDGDGFLHYCVGHGHGMEIPPAAVPAVLKMMRVAFDSGIIVDQTGQGYPGTDGVTALHTACVWRAPWAIDPLLEAGADVNAVNGSGNTPLMNACGHVPPEMLKAVMTPLLAAGAHLIGANESEDYEDYGEDYENHGRSPLAILKWAYHYKIIKGYLDHETLHNLGAAIAALVVAGDRRLDLIPTPCAGLEAALAVLLPEKQTDLLSGIFQRLKPAVQERVRTALLVLKRFCGKMPEELVWSTIATVLE